MQDLAGGALRLLHGVQPPSPPNSPRCPFSKGVARDTAEGTGCWHGPEGPDSGQHWSNKPRGFPCDVHGSSLDPIPFSLWLCSLIAWLQHCLGPPRCHHPVPSISLHAACRHKTWGLRSSPAKARNPPRAGMPTWLGTCSRVAAPHGHRIAEAGRDLGMSFVPAPAPVGPPMAGCPGPPPGGF